jgi:hypothetical protein
MSCLRPPEHMLEPLEQMRKAVPNAFIAAQPVAYRTPKDKPDSTSLPQFPFALDPLQLSRKEMAAYAQRAKDDGINYIGACCGSVAPTSARWRECWASYPPSNGPGRSITKSRCRRTNITTTTRRK